MPLLERAGGHRPPTASSSSAWLARAQHDLAALLLARNGAGDRAWARAHLDEAVAGYRALGMDAWAARAAAFA